MPCITNCNSLIVNSNISCGTEFVIVSHTCITQFTVLSPLWATNSSATCSCALLYIYCSMHTTINCCNPDIHYKLHSFTFVKYWAIYYCTLIRHLTIDRYIYIKMHTISCHIKPFVTKFTALSQSSTKWFSWYITVTQSTISYCTLIRHYTIYCYVLLTSCTVLCSTTIKCCMVYCCTQITHH